MFQRVARRAMGVVVLLLGAVAWGGSAGISTPGTAQQAALLRRVGSLPLQTGEDGLFCSVIDPAGKFAYFGTNTSPGSVVKVRLADMTRVDALPLNPGENSLISAVIDAAGEFAYFGTSTAPGRVVKVQLSNFTRV